MSEVEIRIEGAAGRMTLSRPESLNALSHDMVRDMELALDDWARDDDVALVLIDAAGEAAFCAGGDLHEMHAEGRAGRFAPARRFWRDEYRLNYKLAEFGKPVVSLMQGLTLGGGVGIGCHASHRVVGETSRIGLPEVSIGLVPDVGSSWILSQAPGQIGEYLGTTAARMGPGDAIFAGFADHFLPEDKWPELVRRLQAGTVSAVASMAEPPPAASLTEDRGWIDSAFSGGDLATILARLEAMDFEAPAAAAAALRRNSPLAMAAALAMVRNLRSGGGVSQALAQEFRFAYRAMMLGDFLEGIRAALIDRDRNPRWRHATPADVGLTEVAEMLAPLGEEELDFAADPHRVHS